MDGKDDGLTLGGLAQRLETLERENERMRSENTELRHEVAALRDPDISRAVESAAGLEGRVSRRALLSKAGTAAVAAMAAGMFLNPREAKAHDLNPPIDAENILTHWIWAANHRDPATPAVRAEQQAGGTKGAVEGTHSGSGPGVRGHSAGDTGVEGISASLSGIGVEGIAQGSNGTGVMGTGRYGVWGESNQAGFYGVFGRNTNVDGTGVRGQGGTGVWGSSSRTGYSGVYGQHTGSLGYGVVGDGKGSSGAGVLGRNSGGEGVRGEGSTQAEVAGVRGLGKTGVWGSSSTTGYSGVYGQHTGSGYGVVADGSGSSGAGVLGRNSSGYGGQFEGGKAQLMLKPGGSAGKPGGSHTKGEIYMDSAGTLFVCVASTTSTTTAKWKKVSATAV
jgi:hypothetical protein